MYLHPVLQSHTMERGAQREPTRLYTGIVTADRERAKSYTQTLSQIVSNPEANIQPEEDLLEGDVGVRAESTPSVG